MAQFFRQHLSSVVIFLVLQSAVTSDMICIGCQKRANQKFVPCGHITFCKPCFGKYKKKSCPVCRQAIESVDGLTKSQCRELLPKDKKLFPLEECQLCYASEPVVVLEPCGHVLWCAAWAQKYDLPKIGTACFVCSTYVAKSRFITEEEKEAMQSESKDEPVIKVKKAMKPRNSPWTPVEYVDTNKYTSDRDTVGDVDPMKYHIYSVEMSPSQLLDVKNNLTEQMFQCGCDNFNERNTGKSGHESEMRLRSYIAELNTYVYPALKERGIEF